MVNSSDAQTYLFKPPLFSFSIQFISETFLPLHLLSFSNPAMVKTRGGHNFRLRVRQCSPPLADSPNPGPAAASVVPTPIAAHVAAPVAATVPAPATATAVTQGIRDMGHVSTATAPPPRRYHTRVGPVPPSSPHPRPSRRALPSKRARTSGPGESYNSRPPEPQSPPTQGPAEDLPPDLSPASIIRRPYFHCSPIPRNVDCSERDLHNEIYYDLPAFAEDPELRDSMCLVQRYSLAPFMTPRRFYYPLVVIEFFHTMTSRREPNPTAIHFSIDGWPRILRASDIAATFSLSVVLANSADYRQWPHPSTREMVRLLSRDTTAGPILFKRQLPPDMLLIDHILRSKFFRSNTVQRR